MEGRTRHTHLASSSLKFTEFIFIVHCADLYVRLLGHGHHHFMSFQVPTPNLYDPCLRNSRLHILKGLLHFSVDMCITEYLPGGQRTTWQ